MTQSPMNKALHRLVLSFLILPPMAALAEPASSFGCEALDTSPLPSVEGSDGVFYRVQSDLRLQHPMDDIIVARLAELSRVLAEHGTTLVYVNVPTKGQAMPDDLPAGAIGYGYDPVLMDANYLDVIDRLNAAGVAAPDLMTAMKAAADGIGVFFRSDFHWTPDGARLAAQAIGAVIRNHPAYNDVTPVAFTSTETGPEIAFSGMRRELQTQCKDSLPQAEAATWLTTRTDAAGPVTDATDIFADAPATAEGAAPDATVDIFGTNAAEATLVLVGTSFSDTDINNFAGFLSEYSGIETINYAITGGNQFGSITSYLTSREFTEKRPNFLVWENPIYNSLAQFGPTAMDELIAAAGNTCDIATTSAADGPQTIAADFPTGSLKSTDTLLFDFGNEGARGINITLQTASGITRTVRIDRGERLRATGRFFLRLAPYWLPDITRVAVEFDRPLLDGSAILLCPPSKGDAS